MSHAHHQWLCVRTTILAIIYVHRVYDVYYIIVYLYILRCITYIKYDVRNRSAARVQVYFYNPDADMLSSEVNWWSVTFRVRVYGRNGLVYFPMVRVLIIPRYVHIHRWRSWRTNFLHSLDLKHFELHNYYSRASATRNFRNDL